MIPATSETYTFTVSASGGVGLYYRLHGTTPWKTGYLSSANTSQTGAVSLALTKGQSYDVEVQYWQHQVDGRLRLSWASPTVASQDIEAATPVGINAGAVLPGEPSEIFADVIKQSEVPVVAAGSSTAAAVDANGWPTEDVAIALWGAGALEMDGTYTLSFVGRAQVVDSTGLGSFAAGGKTYGATLPAGAGYSAATNTTTATWRIPSPYVPGTATLAFRQTQRTPSSAVGSGLTDISLMRPLAEGSTESHPSGQLFSKAYTSLLSNFSVIRYMDYLATNGSNTANWSDRITPTLATQYHLVGGWGWQGKGGSLEYAVELANETGKDIWINIPVKASAAYITNVAQLLLYGSDGKNPYTSVQSDPVYPPLNSNLHVYIEYSNELWNSSLADQYQFETTMAENEVAAAAGKLTPLNYDGNTRSYVWQRRYTAQQIQLISSIFRSVWGNAAMMATIRPVFMWDYGQTNNVESVGADVFTQYYDNGSGNFVTNPQPPSYYIYCGGGAWYTYTNKDGYGMSNPTPAEIATSGLSTPLTEADAQEAAALQLPGGVCSYEGGLTIGWSSPTTGIEEAANFVPAAKADEEQALINFFQLARAGGVKTALPLIFQAAGNQFGVLDPTINDVAASQKLLGIQAITGAMHP